MGTTRESSGHADPTALPERPSLETLGRLITRYPDSALMDLVAQRATGLTAAELLEHAVIGIPVPKDAEHLALFAWFTANLDPSPSSLERALRLFCRAFHDSPDLAVPEQVYDTWMRGLAVVDPTATGGPRVDQVHPETSWAVRTDRLNPFLEPPSPLADRPAWEAALSEPFTAAGLEPLHLTDSPLLPFDRLASAVVPGSAGGPLITVIMSVYNPSHSLLTAVNSILAQSWKDFELLVIDDASTTGTDHLAAVEGSDERIRVLRRDRNRGTYSARNHALASARGEFITFQDADDYAHPQRLEQQVGAIGEGTATLARAIRARTDLGVTAVGYRLISWCLPTLFFRREPVLAALGGFDPVRRGADSEFVDRLRAVFGTSALNRIDTPLMVMQMTPDSLSRGDMGSIRRHPARMWYKAASNGWHAEEKDLRVIPPVRPPVPAPAHITGSPSRRIDAQVALLGPVDNAITNDSGAIAGALAEAGLSTAVVEFVSPDATRQPPSKHTVHDHLLVGDDPLVNLALPGQSVRARVGFLLDPAAVLTMPSGSLAAVEVRDLVLLLRRPLPQEAMRSIAGRLAVFATGHVAWLPTTEHLARSVARALPGATVLPPSPWALPTLERRAGHRSTERTGAVSARITGDPWWHPGTTPRGGSPLLDHIWCFGPGPRAEGRITRLRPRTEDWPSFLDTITSLLVPHTEWISPPALDALNRGVELLAPESARPVYGALARYERDQEPDAIARAVAIHLETAATPEALRRSYFEIIARLDDHA